MRYCVGRIGNPSYIMREPRWSLINMVQLSPTGGKQSRWLGALPTLPISAICRAVLRFSRRGG